VGLAPYIALMSRMVVLWIAVLPHFLSSAQHIPANGVMQNHDPMVRISLDLWPGRILIAILVMLVLCWAVLSLG
jgi:hypothetical protein